MAAVFRLLVYFYYHCYLLVDRTAIQTKRQVGSHASSAGVPKSLQDMPEARNSASRYYRSQARYVPGVAPVLSGGRNRVGAPAPHKAHTHRLKDPLDLEDIFGDAVHGKKS